MALDRTWYNTPVDDDGSGMTGTVWDKADVDALMDAVDAEIGRINPGLSGVPVAFTPTAYGDTRLSSSAGAAYVQANKLAWVTMYINDCFLVTAGTQLQFLTPFSPAHYSTAAAYLAVAGVWEVGICIVSPGFGATAIQRNGLTNFPANSTIQVFVTYPIFQ